MLNVRMITALFAVFLGLSPAFAQTSTKAEQQEDARGEGVRILKGDERILDEAPLPMDKLGNAGLSANTMGGGRSAGMASPRVSGMTGNLDSSKAYTSMVDTEGATQASAEGRAFRLYGLDLKPGQKVVFKLNWAGDSFLSQKFGLRRVPGFSVDAMSKAQLERVNRISPGSRAKRIEFKNNTKAEFPLLYVVYGDHGTAYKVEIEYP